MRKTLKLFLISSLLLIVFGFRAFADKGMWIMSELNKQNIERMRELGFKLPIDSLYSLDKPSITNAVVIFGNGCTGITVSNEGLIFTNHHCGYEAIQSQSTVDHDYLRDGFVSQNFAQELPIAGLEVRYLRSVRDVTKEITDSLTSCKTEMERLQKAKILCSKIAIAEQNKLGDNVEVIVEPFYANNAYYMIAYDVFKDVRMVFAPPSSIGKFGGDTDNWMWPRHTGDFSVFRVYAGKDNKPAGYNKENKPFRPKYYAAVSLAGVSKDDYAMTVGFPGSTSRYIPSWGIRSRIDNTNTPRIEVRGIKQEIWKEAMSADQATRIKYASKYAQSANYWKNSIGMNRGLEKLRVLDRKRMEEDAFQKWTGTNKKGEQYKETLSLLKNGYENSGSFKRNQTYIQEALLTGAEVGLIALYANMAAMTPSSKAELLKHLNENVYKDYLPSLDRKVLPAMLKVVKERVPAEYLPDIYITIDKDYGGDYKAYADHLFDTSIIPYADKLNEVMKLPADRLQAKLANDPAVVFCNSVRNILQDINNKTMEATMDISKGNRLYFAGRRVMDPDRQMPSDANFSMRMSYGSVKGYEPSDATWFSYYTTEKGIMEKYDPKSYEFNVQDEILNLIKKKDFGRYAAKDGHLHIAFLSTNDITGGNSGSPVFDKNGRLIGLAFDGNWEAMSGDIEFEPDLQRTISVDIRYVLWTIDKWGKCPRLIKELKLMK